MKVAFVYDRVVKYGGAERILQTLHEIWPESPLYTAIYNQKTASWADNIDVKVSWLKNVPFFLSSYAFESFSFDKFDVVISITSQDAKSIITKPGTLHICYCLTPTRYLWSGFSEYYRQPSLGVLNPIIRLLMKIFVKRLRKWDIITAKRPDKYLAISNTVKDRINKYYSRDSAVIYPPVDCATFVPEPYPSKKYYYLIVSRLVSYKRIDYAISAFNKLKYPLKIIGQGVDLVRLKSLAGSTIEFISGNLTDQKLCWYYQNCRCLIFPGEEDFGLAPVEAQACGRPVIALGRGGSLESVINGKTGIFYGEKSDRSLINAVKIFNQHHFKSADCRKNSLRFSKNVFKQSMKNTILKYLTEYRRTA